MKRHITHILIFSMSLLHTSIYALTCNGYPELCNRRYNEVAYAGTHNASTIGPSLVSNQDRTITQQLAAGIRSMKIPVHFDTYKGKHTIMACHGIYRNVLYTNYLDRMLKKLPENTAGNITGKALKTIVGTPYQAVLKKLEKTYGWSDIEAQSQFHPCFIDPAAKPLVTVLTDIKKFLDKTPDAIVTLTIEDGTGDPRAPQDIAQAVINAGLEPFSHAQDVTKPWPTLGEMVQSHKRLVIFLTSKTEFLRPVQKIYPWLNRQGDFVWKYTYPYDSFKTMKAAIDNNDFTVRGEDNFNARHKPPYNKVLLVGHAVTPTIAGNKKEAAKANQRDFLINMLNKMIDLSDSLPNLIEIDFYEAPNNDIFDVVSYLNKVGKYKTRTQPSPFKK